MKGQLHIESMFAFICTDLDGSEGVPAIGPMPDGTVYPLMGADLERMASLRQYAEKLAEGGRLVKLVKFTHREELEIFPPKKQEGIR